MRSHEYTDVRPDTRPRFRDMHKARFIPDWREHCRPVDRNERAKIMFLAEALERRTKPEGRRNGQLGYVGLQVLKALLFGFLNCTTGLLCPSYEAIRRKTGLCRQSVRNGLARLECTGIVKIAARLVRRDVSRTSPITGEPETIRTTTQATSLYSVHRPGAWADHLARPVGRVTRFPVPRQLDLLERMALTWATRLSLNPSTPDRRNPPPPGAQPLAHWLSRG